MKVSSEYLLSKGVTVAMVVRWMGDQDESAKKSLINLIEARFRRRFLSHLFSIRSGFLQMSVACLMVETLESFRQGLSSTRRLSRTVFEDFFERERVHFPHFHTVSCEFYSNIRCGLLHQGETTGGWRIVQRNAMLLEIGSRTVNSQLFVCGLERSLNDYLVELSESGFEAPVWVMALRKLSSICQHCTVEG